MTNIFAQRPKVLKKMSDIKIKEGREYGTKGGGKK
jgi:hypothetical protein